jgi:alanyl-tRNA synthetase
LFTGFVNPMMTSAQIRQSFLDFFKSKGHTIVPSSSLMPDSPNLLFTNAGMNQFVPIFLGQKKADVSKWAGAVPGKDTRAADTQKCIRAGGKHNDLEDVGLDTYHHTFFEMLGNWSFGDYFKREAIDWAWELVTEVWKFPKNRLYATVYKPGAGDPSELDQEAWDFWAEKFRAAGLDPKVHIVYGNKKDNFWMMGDTGPCGPCSELHVDLTPDGNTAGSLVNQGDARCIEIWNLVFIQFNANPDGTFSSLPAKHVDTGMGFERVTSIIQGTKGFKDFRNAKISNYETDIFRPIFDVLEKLSGKKYKSTLPGSAGVPPASAPLKTSGEGVDNIIELNKEGRTAHAGPASDDKSVPMDTHGLPSQEQIAIDIAFRVIADHIRTISFAIADGIEPGNKERNNVIRRILRRAARYGRRLDFHAPFLWKLAGVLVETMGHVFPELRERLPRIEEVIRNEEESFNRTLDRGLALFDEEIDALQAMAKDATAGRGNLEAAIVLAEEAALKPEELKQMRRTHRRQLGLKRSLSGEAAFVLSDTYGFPIDLTELIARERGFGVDRGEFNKFVARQKEIGREDYEGGKEVISLSQIETQIPTKFVGYDQIETKAKVLEVVGLKDKTAVVLDVSPLYAEMGGQVGDTGELTHGADHWRVVNTQKNGNTWLHFISDAQSNALRSESAPDRGASLRQSQLPVVGAEIKLTVDQPRRNAIQRHHTVTHLLHWALHEVVSRDASQKGSFVGPDKLTFDFNSQPLTPQQVADVEKLVNERILENAGVSWTEVPYNDVKGRKDVMQFFGEKYGDSVRVVQVGGEARKLNGYSMELCGGTHTRATGEIGLFRIVGENAIAAGVRRIEAVAGLEAYRKANDELHLIKSLAGKVNSPVHELDKKIESLLAHQKELEKQIKAAQQREASNAAGSLLAKTETINGVPAIIQNLGSADGDFLQGIADSLKSRFKGVIVLGAAANGAVALVASVSSDFTAKIQAGKIIQQIAPIVGGKGGGKPDNARGGGKDAAKLDEALAKAKASI